MAKPSVAAMELAERLHYCVGSHFTMSDKARIVEAAVWPLVSALRDLVAQVTSPDVNQMVDEEYLIAARAALAEWERQDD